MPWIVTEVTPEYAALSGAKSLTTGASKVKNDPDVPTMLPTVVVRTLLLP